MIKNGQKPLAAKKQALLIQENPFGDPLRLDEALKAEISEQNLECRFIDAKQAYEMNGYHKNGWTPYKKKAADTIGLKYGSDPDGIVRRGSVILASRPKELGVRHRALLAAKAQRSNAVVKTQADSLRAMVRERQADVTVVEGYDEN